MTAANWLKSAVYSVFGRQTVYFFRGDLHFNKVHLLGYFKKSPSSVKPNATYLNVGCGSLGVANEQWCNVDGWPAPNVDCVVDLRKKLPFDDGSFDGVFCEHFLEHLTPRDGRLFMSECFRVLRPGGRLRVSVPDGELYIRKYLEDRDWIVSQRDGRFQTPMEVVNHVFRQVFEHQFCYDAETLKLYLSEAGFDTVNQVGYLVGENPDLLLDQEVRSFESLYVEAKK